MKTLIETLIADPDFKEPSAWRRRNFSANQIVIHEGEEGLSLFYVEQGQLRVNVEVALEAQRSVKPGLSELQSGDIFGEICLHGAYFRTASVSALTDSTLIEIDGQQLKEFLAQRHTLGYQFYKTLFEIYITRLYLANNRIESLFAWGLKAHGLDKHF